MIQTRELPYREEGAQELLERSLIPKIMMGASHLAEWADLIFVAVQTPHQPEYEGITRLPQTRADFAYGHLWQALRGVEMAECPVAVISTVLPGTIDTLLRSTP